MEHALRIGLRAEVLPGPIQLEAGGCLTVDNVGALLRVIGQSVSLEGCPGITVTLDDVEHLEPAAMLALDAHVSAHERARRVLGRDVARVLPFLRVRTPPRPRPCPGLRPVALPETVGAR